MAFPIPTGYAPGGVNYYRPRPVVKPKRYRASPTGYAPGGVSYLPLDPAHRVGAGGAAISPTRRPARGAGAAGNSLWAQALGLSNKALAPLLAATNASYDRERAAEVAAIKAATAEYVKATRGYAPEVAGAYRQAQGAQSAGDTALAALLQGKGTESAAALTKNLGGAAGGEGSAALDAIGRGATAAGYGAGSADLDKLLASGAAAAEYGAKLPGLAALTGLRDTSSTVARLGRERMDALGQLTSAAPGQALGLYENMINRRDARSEAQANREQAERLAYAGGLVDTSVAASKAGQTEAKLNETIRHNQAMEANTELSIEQRRDAATAAAEAKKQLKAIQDQAKQVRHGKQRQSAFYTTRSKAFTMAHALAAPPPKSSGGTGGMPSFGASPGSDTAPTGHKVSRAAARAQVWNKWAPVLIHQWGYKRSAVNKMVDAAIRAAYGPAKKPKKNAPPGPSGPPGSVNYNPLAPPMLPGVDYPGT